MGIHVDAPPFQTRVASDVSGPTIDAGSQTQDPQVVTSIRTWAGALYVIAVNAGDSATDATIDVPSLRGRTLTVLAESRMVDANGGSFTDHFDPLDVHIYVEA